MSLNPSLLGQEFCREREALPGYKIKTANLLITFFSLRAAADEKILSRREGTFMLFHSQTDFMTAVVLVKCVRLLSFHGNISFVNSRRSVL